MKLVLSVAIILLSVCAIYTSTLEDDDRVLNYLKEFKINLRRSDWKKVKQTLINHFREVDEHNKYFNEGKVAYELGTNEFSYLTYDQFISRSTGSLESNETGIPYQSSSARFDGPESFSWLDYPGVVQSVQNQGACGSCWAFGAIGAIEGQLALRKGINVKLSEQEVIECARHPQNGNLLGCNGGWHFAVYNHARDKIGVATQTTKPYLAHTNFPCSPPTNRVREARTPRYVSVQTLNENSMKEALRTKGPLYVTYFVSQDFYSYQSGVYTDRLKLCTKNKPNNHAVLLVGYGRENGVDYWLLKNSWGTGFGESGFFKMERGRNLCGIAETVNYPILL